MKILHSLLAGASPLHYVMQAGLALVLGFALPAFAQQPNTLIHSIPASPVGTQTSAYLGVSVAVDGTLTVAGAPYDDIGAQNSGVVKVFNSTTGALLYLIPNPTRSRVTTSDTQWRSPGRE